MIGIGYYTIPENPISRVPKLLLRRENCPENIVRSKTPGLSENTQRDVDFLQRKISKNSTTSKPKPSKSSHQKILTIKMEEQQARRRHSDVIPPLTHRTTMTSQSVPPIRERAVSLPTNSLQYSPEYQTVLHEISSAPRVDDNLTDNLTKANVELSSTSEDFILSDEYLESVEKCKTWLKTLPDKFPGLMHLTINLPRLN